MAILGLKKTKKEVVKKDTKATVVKTASEGILGSVGEAVILRPHITEKAGLLSTKNVYTFEVSPRATKITIAKAIESIFKVVPVKVAVVTVRAEKIVFRGKRGTTSGGKKAYVTLKEGDKIDFI
jgi:large subunit ribosomal protein L23